MFFVQKLVAYLEKNQPKVRQDQSVWFSSEATQSQLLQTSKQDLEKKFAEKIRNPFSLLAFLDAFQHLTRLLKEFILEKHRCVLKEEIEKAVQIGDILAVERNHYIHYGIYSGQNRIIHFTSEKSDISTENKLIETDLSYFFRDQLQCFIIEMEHTFVGKNPLHNAWIRMCYQAMPELLKKSIPALETLPNYHLYSREETVRRARICLTESEDEMHYCFVRHNCEHFVYWCRTGVCHSEQVKTIISTLIMSALLAFLTKKFFKKTKERDKKLSDATQTKSD